MKISFRDPWLTLSLGRRACGTVPVAGAAVVGLALGFVALAGALQASAPGTPLPFVKQWTPEEGSNTTTLRLTAVDVRAESDALDKEARILESILRARGIAIREGGVPVRLAIGDLAPPIRESVYRERLRDQSYRLTVARDSVRIVAPTAGGVYYGIRTLEQLIDESGGAALGEALDWPDLPVRMVMVDPARQNETMDYYRRMIEFCGRYKINAMLVHLTDDQTACLYHEDYPELMHPEAWRPGAIGGLVEFARAHHIELIPEIESFGHSRMFTRREDYREILHRNLSDKSTISWMQPTAPGYSNVLCPASPKTYDYLGKMYARATESFPSRFLHIGFDEVDMTECDRCNEAFPGIGRPEWFLKHLLRCRVMVSGRGRATILWGDMLLAHPEIAEGLPRRDVVIHDWNYKADVTDESARFFKERGFETVACPALMCAPHFLYPNHENHTNVRRFAAIAREHDLLGINTTIWVPVRYMSDVLWPSVALAAVHSWGGSQWDDHEFRISLMRRTFGPERAGAIGSLWSDMAAVTWSMKDFFTACWTSAEGLEKARGLLAEREADVMAKRAALARIERDFQRLTPGIERNIETWNALARSASILGYALDRLAASREVRFEDGTWDRARLDRLEAGVDEALEWIESDWDRNRHPDDPNKEGIHLPAQHLLWRFKEMREFHRAMKADPR